MAIIKIDWKEIVVITPLLGWIKVGREKMLQLLLKIGALWKSLLSCARSKETSNQRYSRITLTTQRILLGYIAIKKNWTQKCLNVLAVLISHGKIKGVKSKHGSGKRLRFPDWEKYNTAQYTGTCPLWESRMQYAGESAVLRLSKIHEYHNWPI